MGERFLEFYSHFGLQGAWGPLTGGLVLAVMGAMLTFCSRAFKGTVVATILIGLTVAHFIGAIAHVILTLKPLEAEIGLGAAAVSVSVLLSTGVLYTAGAWFARWNERRNR